MLGNYKCGTLKQAMDAIAGLGLLLGDVDPADSKNDPDHNLVLFQYPLPGAKVFVGSTVNFFTEPETSPCSP
jgi:hypothetical protein